MIISKKTYKKFKRRDYFPLFFYEHYKRPRNKLFVIDNDRCNDFVFNVIDWGLTWSRTSQGYDFWNDIYKKEFNNAKK